jgi:hypothetical protein
MVKNPLIFLETKWSNQSCFEFFFFKKKIGLDKLTLLTSDLNLVSSRLLSQVLKLR